ncbi:betaine aldehyde dehydrogenase [Paracoccidioides lutzii Pb01]|uniref:aldehyde dehydrogenase (NAD(+)) n=1 Tax=Paracoccidioides lutzii (strain ATCC MYA-826 / Pb01) TaxID=502779 RepID=C1H3P9_PARBA|nr:betaine aldehyde dehydrogenase [Paracoccidioides lutzii Pb01]EEH34343.1 betaine aldehyde dehydrogenase [Paracoccidioides lutzii Pb01]
MGSVIDFTTFQNVIGGKLSTTAQTRHGINPATGNPNPEVPVSTPADVDNAVEAGKAAFKLWSKTSIEERKKALLTFADALEAHKDEFIKLLVREQGKPVTLATIEIQNGIASVRGRVNLTLKDETVEDSDDRQVIVRYTPLGVVVGIVPWNFPFFLALLKISPAVITGNTIIIKPSPFTPYCGLKLVEIAQKAFPPGVIQALSGDDSLGPWLTAHPGPAKISFTGSSATGKKVMESASKTLKRVTLELGGNDPAIICADIDIEAVAQKVAMMAFMNSGQICIAIKRIYVHESIYEKFREAVSRVANSLVVGEGNEDGVSLGPIQNSMQYERVKGFFADIEKEKWTVAAGGNADIRKPGYFVQPTIIDAPPADSRIVVEEPFGPIVPLIPWNDEAAVIEAANNTKMGLGSSVWSNDLTQARRIGDQIEAGSVWINTHQEMSPFAPFGGHKESGIGYEGGIGGLKSFCNAQAIYIKKNKL